MDNTTVALRRSRGMAIILVVVIIITTITGRDRPEHSRGASIEDQAHD